MKFLHDARHKAVGAVCMTMSLTAWVDLAALRLQMPWYQIFLKTFAESNII
jgi:hypothetical protein